MPYIVPQLFIQRIYDGLWHGSPASNWGEIPESNYATIFNNMDVLSLGPKYSPHWLMDESKMEETLVDSSTYNRVPLLSFWLFACDEVKLNSVLDLCEQRITKYKNIDDLWSFTVHSTSALFLPLVDIVRLYCGGTSKSPSNYDKLNPKTIYWGRFDKKNYHDHYRTNNEEFENRVRANWIENCEKWNALPLNSWSVRYHLVIRWTIDQIIYEGSRDSESGLLLKILIKRMPDIMDHVSPQMYIDLMLGSRPKFGGNEQMKCLPEFRHLLVETLIKTPNSKSSIYFDTLNNGNFILCELVMQTKEDHIRRLIVKHRKLYQKIPIETVIRYLARNCFGDGYHLPTWTNLEYLLFLFEIAIHLYLSLHSIQCL